MPHRAAILNATAMMGTPPPSPSAHTDGNAENRNPSTEQQQHTNVGGGGLHQQPPLPVLGPEGMCLLSFIPLSLSLKEHHCFHYSKNRKDFGVGVDLDPRNLTGECTRGEHVASKKNGNEVVEDKWRVGVRQSGVFIFLNLTDRCEL